MRGNTEEKTLRQRLSAGKLTRADVVRRLGELGVEEVAPPDGAFYAYFDVSRWTDDSVAWCADVLDRTGVALTPGVDFDTVDGRHTVRLSFAGSTDEIAEAMVRLEAVLVD